MYKPPTDLAYLFPTLRNKKVQWRDELNPYIYDIYGCCFNCERPASSIHEAIIRRSAAQGWKLKKRVLIFTVYNCIPLCDKCHGTAAEPSKEKVLRIMIETYGTDVLDWLESLPFKSNPVQGLINFYREKECLKL